MTHTHRVQLLWVVQLAFQLYWMTLSGPTKISGTACCLSATGQIRYQMELAFSCIFWRESQCQPVSKCIFLQICSVPSVPWHPWPIRMPKIGQEIGRSETQFLSWLGYGSIPIDTFLVGWTSINPSYDLGFTRGTRVLTQTGTGTSRGLLRKRGGGLPRHRRVDAAWDLWSSGTGHRPWDETWRDTCPETGCKLYNVIYIYINFPWYNEESTWIQSDTIWYNNGCVMVSELSFCWIHLNKWMVTILYDITKNPLG